MKKHNLLIAMAIASLMTSCNRLDVAGMIVNRSDTEERVAEWLLYNEQHGEPIIENVPDHYRFYACADPHYSSRDNIEVHGENDRIYQVVTMERNDPDACFSVILGDLANESGETPYEMIESSLAFDSVNQTKNDPCFCIIGNHDLYYDCADWYKKHCHTSTYSLVVKTQSGCQDLFIMLDSGNGTHGKRQLEWLKEKLLHRADYRNCIVFSHNWLFRTSYNYTTTPAANLPLEEQYAFMDLMRANAVTLVMMGHFHYREQRQFNGITYVMSDNLNESKQTPNCMVVDCGEEVQYEYRDLSF